MRAMKRKAFTLVEMMAVVVIIGILAAVIAPRFFGQVGQASKVRVKQDVEMIKKAVTLYKFNTHHFPQEIRDLVNEPDGVNGWEGPYLEKMPKDPWGNDYQFASPGGDNRQFDVWSYGRDGREGGEGEDADVLGWEVEE